MSKRQNAEPAETTVADQQPDWENEPARNPEFNGATPRDLAKALLRQKVAERRAPAAATSAK